MEVNSDTSQKKAVRSRQRASTSCTECRRRKQKCNQTRDKPCNNCSRRYPPVACTYESIKKPSKYKEKVIGLDATKSKPETPEAGGSEVLAAIDRSRSSNSGTSLFGNYQLELASRPASAPPDKTESQPLYASIRDIAPAVRFGRYYSFPEHLMNSYNGITKMSVGSTLIEPLRSLPIEATRRNAEHFHFFIEMLSPFMSSLDGNSPPSGFNTEWLSFLAQSPIAIYVTILTSCYFHATAHKIDVDKSLESTQTKVKLIALINEHIKSHGNSVSDDSIAAVMSLAYNELIYADERSTFAHMSGLREMLRTRGGIQNIEFATLRKMLIRTDYQVACTFERDLVIQDDVERQSPVPVLKKYPISLDNPLLQSHIRFTDSAKALDITLEVASILDDMRFLTTSVLQLSKNPFCTPQEIAKFLTTAHWIHSRLTSSSSPNPSLATDFIYQTCRTTAIIYSSAILTRTPLSMSCTHQLLQQLWMTMWRVPLPRWKKTPGIFFWVLLVANPYARDKLEGRFLKGLTPACAMGIGTVDWDTVMAIWKGFFEVQKWLGGELRVVMGRELSKQVAESQIPAGGLPLWTYRDESQAKGKEIIVMRSLGEL